MEEHDGRWRHWSTALQDAPVACNYSMARRLYVPLGVLAVVVVLLMSLAPPFVCVRTSRGSTVALSRVLIWGTSAAIATAAMTACGALRTIKYEPC